MDSKDAKDINDDDKSMKNEGDDDSKMSAAESSIQDSESKGSMAQDKAVAGDDDEDAPDAVDENLLAGAYNQTYVIHKTSERLSGESKTSGDNPSYQRGVFFRCGNWCYAGELSFGVDEIGLSDLPRMIPLLQRQQGKLAYYCTYDKVPERSEFYKPLQMHWTAEEFLAQELSSEKVAKELEKWSKVFTWIDGDSESTYFELQMDLPEGTMEEVALIASKSYCRGLVLITIFHEGTFYVVVQPGEGDQPLLDVRFPDVSRHGQGLHVHSYNNPDVPWQKLTLWHAPSLGMPALVPQIRDKQLLDLSSDSYLQTYVVMDASDSSNPTQRQALFRFGSWCYSGDVTLTPVITLKDIPHVIPALRLQQNKLSYMCDVTKMPARSPFALPMQKMLSLMPMIEHEVGESEEVLGKLIEKMESMGLGASVSNWLESDTSSSFFEFTMAPNEELKQSFQNVDIVATKCYQSQGVILITIYFKGTIYVVLKEGGEDQPLLDSQFPDVSGKGRGYQVKAYNRGVQDWPELRKVAVWQTQASLQAEIQARMQAKEASKKKADDAKDDESAGSKSMKMIEDSPQVKADHKKELKEEEPSTPDAKAESKTDSRRVLPTMKVNAPHYVAPMRDERLEEKLAKMRLDAASGGPAPWDKYGRPIGSSSPLRK
mmetsp:Transcript_11031/g.14377  ORF Transcript_11031/g.14377 Transcript_11031/m.14377 type:complete len:657 (+) Transcript_11031:68-2038(+)